MSKNKKEHNKEKKHFKNPFSPKEDESNQSELLDEETNVESEKKDESEDNKNNEECSEEKNISKEETNNEDDLKKKFEALNNQYVRLAADFDNYRKRQAVEREQLLNYGLEKSLQKMIEVLDNFDRAEKTFDTIDSVDKAKENFEILHKQVVESLEKLGLEKINTENQKFDPNLHEAVMQTPTNDYEDHTIIQELQKGYKLGEKVLRPSLVNVAVNEQ